MEALIEKDIQQYILYLKREKGFSAGTINNYISAIRFFYTYVLGKVWNPQKIPRMKRRAHFPVIPPREDVLAQTEYFERHPLVGGGGNYAKKG